MSVPQNYAGPPLAPPPGAPPSGYGGPPNTGVPVNYGQQQLQQQQLQQQQFQLQQQQALQQQQGFNVGGDPDYTQAHKKYPHPGEHYLTTAQLVRRYLFVFIFGFTIGGWAMWYIFPILYRIGLVAIGG